MTTYKFTYFSVKGRGEAIRMMILDNGDKYEEIDCGPKWAEIKPTMPFGQTPLLEDGDMKLVQSNAILRYLGRKYNAYGADAKEAYKIDMVNDGVEDVRVAYTIMIYKNYEAGKQPHIDSLPEKLKPFENLVGTNDYISGKNVSWADYNLFDLLDIHLVLSPPCLDSFPNLKAYYQRMLQRPGIQARRNTDNCKNMPINGNGKQ